MLQTRDGYSIRKMNGGINPYWVLLNSSNKFLHRNYYDDNAMKLAEWTADDDKAYHFNNLGFAQDTMATVKRCDKIMTERGEA